MPGPRVLLSFAVAILFSATLRAVDAPVTTVTVNPVSGNSNVITASAGQTFQVKATGTVNLATFDGPYDVNPDGVITVAPPIGSNADYVFTNFTDPIGVDPVVGTQRFTLPGTGATVVGSPIGALIGSWNSGPWFVIGSTAQIVSPSDRSQLSLWVNDFYYPDNTGSFAVTLSTGCQVNVQPTYSQCSAPWGTTRYDSDAQNRTMCTLGCATTALTMALGAGGVPALPGPFSGFVNLDPGSLNQFMTFHPEDYVGDFVQFEAATLDVGFASTALTGGKTLYFDDSINGDNNPVDLKTAVCDGHAVIVKVSPIAKCTVQFGAPGGHYVLVTGEQDDSSGNPHFTIADPGCQLGFGSLPPITSLDAYNNTFLARGFVSDPANVSTLEIVSDNNADLLVTDFLGNQTGLNIKQIPRSSYAQDFLTDNDTGLQATGVTHSVNVFQPTPGMYGITVIGLKVGTYTLVVARFSADGTPQPTVQVGGIAGLGSRTAFQVGFSNAASSGVTLIATFASTLADIQNSLQLGLIDNQAIANSLSQKIQAAQSATGPARNNILNAFKNDVNAQSGKHVTGIAPQVLLQDADSLISQNP